MCSRGDEVDGNGGEAGIVQEPLQALQQVINHALNERTSAMITQHSGQRHQLTVG